MLPISLPYSFLKSPSVLQMAHDSYFCTSPAFRGPTYRPFPTRIEGRQFVSYGPRFNGTKRNNRKCPLKCRPPDHPDWDLC